MSMDLGLCSRCGLPWHPLVLCIGYRLLGTEFMEKLSAEIYNRGFEEWGFDRAREACWENEGGRSYEQ